MLVDPSDQNAMDEAPTGGRACAFCGGLGRGHDATTEAGHPFDLTAVSTATSIARWLLLGVFLGTALKLATARRSLGDPRIAAVIFGAQFFISIYISLSRSCHNEIPL